jgi:hypothetical protein
LDGGGRLVVGHQPLQLQEGPDPFQLIEAQRHVAVPAGPAGLGNPDRAQ